MADELLDLVNKNDEVIGTVWKSAAHKDPALIHREVVMVLFTMDGKVLLQQRSMQKATNPGVWEITAAGHVGSGEDPKLAVVREVEEELGITTYPKFWKKEYNLDEEYSEAKFYWTYYDVLKEEVKPLLDENEVMDAKWVKVTDLEQFAKDHDYSLPRTSQGIIIALSKMLGFIGKE